ncbi:MAG: hypothetical protein JWM47_3651 [Acidimicrobiales bacterium]|nr:hypothetical protein [Acidimicrobiales bacterium]
MTTRGTKGFVAVLVVLAIGVAGCSSDGGDDTPSAGATTTAVDGTDGSVPEPTGVEDTLHDDGGPAEPSRAVLRRYASYTSKSYDDASHWVCRPDMDDICDGDLDTTVIEADGTTSVERFEADPDAPVDCFYVYPTISRDETPFSDWEASPEEEGFVTLQQAARLGSVCRVFAPVYRQATLASLTSRLSGSTLEGPEADPFADVLDAFRTYMAKDNGGRGVVLIGHSQGSSMLNQLIETEVDPNEDVRTTLVGAYLAGSAVAVPEGKTVGGDFSEVPLCTAAEPAGCVTTWATFRATAPPPANSYFGRVRDAEGGQVAGCVNPAAVGGEAELHAYFPADASASILSSLGNGEQKAWLTGDAAEAIETPFVSLPGLVTGECTSTDGFNYLSATVHGDPADPRADDISGDITPEWGLHLIDVSLVMGDIVDRVREQTEAHGR